MAGQGQDMKQGLYRSPADFMGAVRQEFPLSWDLAACTENTQAEGFYDEGDDALSCSWHQIGGGWLWLNPPYSNIEPWARKGCLEMQYGAKILLLLPASVGSDWYAEWIHNRAEVRFLRPRLIFEFRYPDDYKDKAGNLSHKAGCMNTDPYPKDLMLCLFDRTSPRPKVSYPWKWK